MPCRPQNENEPYFQVTHAAGFLISSKPSSSAWRDKLAPHVRVYSRRDLESLFNGLPVKFIERTLVFGAYDNIIARFGGLGKALRGVLQMLEKTPLKELGLSHFWVVERQS